MSPFEFKTEPMAHQAREFELSSALPTRGLFWEPGCGKTKPVLDTAAALFEGGEIGGLLVFAPDGVQRNWINDEIPAHLPDRVAEKARTMAWSTQRAPTRAHAAQFDELVKHRSGLAVLSASYHSLMTDAGAKAVRAFLTSRRCLLAADESHFIKTPSAKRTIRVQAASKYAPYRRVLTGTPVDNLPFDVYAQVRFLDPGAFLHLGVTDSASFKSFFGVWEKRRDSADREYDMLVTFRNLDRLAEVVARVGSRLLKADVLDLPEKNYQRVYFQMDPPQRRVYEELRTEFMTRLECGELVTAALALVRITRLQQITSGYLPSDSERELRPISERNPRLRAYMELREGIPGKCITWAKYDVDIDSIAKALRAEGREVHTYDGRTDEAGREEAKAAFQRGSATDFVAKPSAAGTGLTLHAASHAIFYNTSYALGSRLQAEDRIHRIGQKHRATYYDLVAEGTIDSAIIQSLRAKRDWAAIVTGDELRPWI